MSFLRSAVCLPRGKTELLNGDRHGDRLSATPDPPTFDLPKPCIYPVYASILAKDCTAPTTQCDTQPEKISICSAWFVRADPISLQYINFRISFKIIDKQPSLLAISPRLGSLFCLSPLYRSLPNTTLFKMQLLNSAGLLAVLTFGSVVSSLPSAVTEAKSVFDPDVTYEVCSTNPFTT